MLIWIFHLSITFLSLSRVSAIRNHVYSKPMDQTLASYFQTMVFQNSLLTSSILDKFKNKQATPTIIGFGSLISERSSRSTFPNLEEFRFIKVFGFRRVFSHPAAIFFERGIADCNTPPPPNPFI